MLWKMLGSMRTTLIFNLLLLVQFVPLVRSNSTSVKEKLSISEASTEIIGLTCTSRTLGDIALDAFNVTTDDGSDPYCPDGYFCDLLLDGSEDSIDRVLGLCKPCSGAANSCSSDSLLAESVPDPESIEFLVEIAVEEECQNQCGETVNKCSSVEDCPLGLFCNFENAEEGGYCEQCPWHMYFCGEEKNLTSKGLNACESSCSIACTTKGVIEIANSVTGKTDDIEDVNTMNGSPQLKATGPIIDCGLGLEPCEGAEGAICFIERGLSPFINKTQNCHAGGGVGAVIYNVEASCENIRGTFAGQEVMIPGLSLTHIDGKAILEKAKAMPPETPLVATVEVGGHDTPPASCTLGCIEDNECEGTDFICDWDNGDFGDCRDEEQKVHCSILDTFISDSIPCTGEKEFCDASNGGRGFCQPCPEVVGGCFFSDLTSDGVKECNAVCADGKANKVNAKPCKFCPKGDFVIGDIGDGFQSTEEEAETTPCEFCATTSTTTCSNVNRWDMKYPTRT